MVKLSEKSQRIAKAHIKGEKNKDIGAREFPEATPESQAVLISKELKKPQVAQYIEQGKLKAIQDSGITWDKVIRPIADALEALKQNQYTGEYQIDHSTRLRASKQAIELLQDIKPQTPPLPDDIKEALNTSDEVKLREIIFKNR